MLEHYTRSLDTDIYINAALRLGLEVDILSESRSFCRISRGDKHLLVNSNALSLTSTVHRRLVYDKALTLRLFAKAGIACHAWRLFPIKREKDILAYCAEHRPVVIKPNTGSLGAGVCVNPKDDAEVLAAVEKLKAMRRNYVLIEGFIPGDNYRIVLYEGNVLCVLKWVPPYVVGDGSQTIASLIEAKNAYRKQCRMTPVTTQVETVEAQGYTMGHVLSEGAHCRVNASFFHAVGGETVRVDRAHVHPDNLALFVAAAKATYLDFSGIDFISSDIGVSYRDNQAAINEINACPNIDIVYYADSRESPVEVEILLKQYFRMQ